MKLSEYKTKTIKYFAYNKTYSGYYNKVSATPVLIHMQNVIPSSLTYSRLSRDATMANSLDYYNG